MTQTLLKVEQEEYKKLLKENITKNYKKSNLMKLYNINKNANFRKNRKNATNRGVYNYKRL